MNAPENTISSSTQEIGISQAGAYAQKRDLTLRAVEESDFPFLLRLYASTRPDIVALPWSDEQKTTFLLHQINAQRTDYERRFPQSAHSIIERSQGTARVPLGRIWVAVTPHEIRLLDIVLAPEQCGQGFGTALLLDLIATATQRHLLLRHAVEASNSPARRFYERLGFQVAEDVGTHLFMTYGINLRGS